MHLLLLMTIADQLRAWRLDVVDQLTPATSLLGEVINWLVMIAGFGMFGLMAIGALLWLVSPPERK